MSDLAPSVLAMHHPWRAFRALVDWTLEWADLPDGLLGFTDFGGKRVVLARGMDQAQRRCTIAHETQHILRGLAECDREEEPVIDKHVARLLLPDLKHVADAMVWHLGDYEKAAGELWVDEEILRMRLATQHPAELGYLRNRFAEHVDLSGR